MWMVKRPTVTSVAWLIASAVLGAPGVVLVANMTVPW
jgi:hypothetical protein